MPFLPFSPHPPATPNQPALRSGPLKRVVSSRAGTGKYKMNLAHPVSLELGRGLQNDGGMGKDSGANLNRQCGNCVSCRANTEF